MAKQSTGKTNKTKGSNAERYYAKRFREELGFDKCVTSRFGSKLHDNAKIDLLFIPYNIQIKAGRQKGLGYSKTLQEIRDSIQTTFPDFAVEHTFPDIVIHKKEVDPGKARTPNDELVIMSFDTFKKLIQHD